MPTELDILTFRHPRRSSDFCVAAESSGSGFLAAVYGVCDTIGRPRGVWWRRYANVFEKHLRQALDEQPLETIEDTAALLRREIARHNDLTYALRTRHDATAFGHCICLAAVCGRACRIHWLGDCRAYVFERMPSPGGEAPRVRATCLTRDQNGLSRLLDERPSTVLFRSEMHELGRELDCFLGVSDDGAVERTMASQDVRATLDARSCLMMCTDGFYLPLVRARMDARNFDLTPEEYYLTPWLESFLSRPEFADLPWSAVIEALIRESLAFGRRNRHYRDDVAVVGVCRPPATAEDARLAEAEAAAYAGLPESRPAL